MTFVDVEVAVSACRQCVPGCDQRMAGRIKAWLSVQDRRLVVMGSVESDDLVRDRGQNPDLVLCEAVRGACEA